jgi:hypothetical protein
MVCIFCVGHIEDYLEVEEIGSEELKMLVLWWMGL